MTTPKTHFVYIVCCNDGTLYTGYTTDIERRIATHNAGKGGRYTRTHRPVSLLARWEFNTKSQALHVEDAIKRLPRAQKVQLIESGVLFPYLLKRSEEKTK